MLEQLGGSPQDEDETETPEGSPDPTVLLAAAGRFEEHPLFPRADGTPETREIKFVSFCRKRTGDQAIQNCPEDIPARDVKSWAQVVEWWGGGEYKAIAKDAKHRMVAWYPNGNGDWMSFDGDSKPFVLRSGKGYSAPGRATAPASATPAPAAPEPAPAPAPTSQEALMGMMAQVLQEIRNARVAPAPPAADSALVAMIQAQATQATATTQANAQMMQTLLSVVAQRPAETAARPAEPTTLALQLIGGLQKLVPAPPPVPAPAPGLAEQIPLIKALHDLYQPAARFDYAPSARQPIEFPNTEHGRAAERDMRRDLELPYLFIVTRLMHYLRMIHRDHGDAWESGARVAAELTTWIGQYVDDRIVVSLAARARSPLRKARIRVFDDPIGADAGRRLELQVQPGFRCDGRYFTLTIVSRLIP